MNDNPFLIWLPIVLCLLGSGVLLFFSALASQHGKELQKREAPRAVIMPYALIAGVGPLVAAVAFVYSIYLIAQVLFPTIL